jgi:hypothetical protein
MGFVLPEPREVSQHFQAHCSSKADLLLIVSQERHLVLQRAGDDPHIGFVGALAEPV